MKANKLVPTLNVSDIKESLAWFEKVGWEELDGHAFRVGTGIDEGEE